MGRYLTPSLMGGGLEGKKATDSLLIPKFLPQTTSLKNDTTLATNPLDPPASHTPTQNPLPNFYISSVLLRITTSKEQSPSPKPPFNFITDLVHHIPPK